MNLERLNQLAAVLYSVPASAVAFDMSRWISQRRNCGTAACALGHAALDPWMQEQGLHLVIGLRRISTVEQYNAWAKECPVDAAFMTLPVFGLASGYDAAIDFFGITDAAASYLFDPSWYPGADDIPLAAVIARVDEVIGLGGDAPPDAEECGER